MHIIMGNNGVIIKESSIEGNGLYAAENFKKGERVYSYQTGKIITKGKAHKLTKNEKRYVDKINENQYEVIEPPARYVNHSCSPNIAEKGRVAYAIRDIEKGEEITIDYDPIAYQEKPFKCQCGSKNCRKIVYGVR